MIRPPPAASTGKSREKTNDMTDKYPSPIDPNALHIECANALHAAYISWQLGNLYATTYRAITNVDPDELPVLMRLDDLDYLSNLENDDPEMGDVVYFVWRGGSLWFCVQDE